MTKNQKPCPQCKGPMHRQSKMCKTCYAELQKTPERRKQASKRMKGRPSYKRTEWHRKNLSEKLKGRQQRGVGWHHSEETKRKMARHWTPERKAAKRLEQQLIYEDYDNRLAIALALTGKKNPNYQHGLGSSRYGPGYGAKYAKLLKSQKGKCEHCGKANCALDLHHKDFGRTNHLPDNLLCVCRSCHKLIHSKHKKFQKA